jgi:hypothetical protein
MNDELIQRLAVALLGIYATTGKTVQYTTEDGRVRPYWANRFRQAVQRAIDDGTVVEFVERLVLQPEPSRGFHILADADRLDLSVEALVVDEKAEFHGLFSPEAVAASKARLAEFSYRGSTSTTLGLAVSVPASAGAPADGPFEIDMRVRVAADGAVSLSVLR